MFQQGFQEAVDYVTEQCKGYFSDRLLAIYIAGSVYTNEAVQGESDLDYWGVTSELSEQDRIWIKQIEENASYQFPRINGFHINFRSFNSVKKETFTRLILEVNSKLYYGSDVIARINLTDSLDRIAMAKQRLPFARKCLHDALQKKCPESIDKIPENTYYASRKYARYFIVVEGAYFLMCKNSFENFCQEQIVRQLKENIYGFNDVLDLALRVLNEPIKTGVAHEEFLQLIKPVTERFFDEIEAIHHMSPELRCTWCDKDNKAH